MRDFWQRVEDFEPRCHLTISRYDCVPLLARSEITSSVSRLKTKLGGQTIAESTCILARRMCSNDELAIVSSGTNLMIAHSIISRISFASFCCFGSMLDVARSQMMAVALRPLSGGGASIGDMLFRLLAVNLIFTGALIGLLVDKTKVGGASSSFSARISSSGLHLKNLIIFGDYDRASN